MISHVFFVNDAYLFFRATPEESQCIKECSCLYGKATGQQVNFEKSCIHLSCNTSNSMVELVSQTLQGLVSSEASFNLGLPSYIGRNKWEVVKYVKENVWNWMQSWKEKILSKAGKDIC